MLHITDAMIDAAVTPQDAQQALLEAFRSFGGGRAAMQERMRTEAGGTKLSTMAAVMPDQGVAGAKVYTTIKGQFDFIILLFSAKDGRPLATMQANAITRLRTAACSVIASRHLARPASKKLAVFGAGVQGQAHAMQFSRAYALDEIRVCDPYAPADLAQRMQRDCGAPVRMFTEAAPMLDGADIVVTASRSTSPLFTGSMLSAGSFVAAIGSSLPLTREMDDACLERASTIAVEWKPQSLREAGDLVQAAAGVLEGKVVELGELVTGRHPGRRNEGEVTLYKSVGVALEDIALAAVAWERISG